MLTLTSDSIVTKGSPAQDGTAATDTSLIVPKGGVSDFGQATDAEIKPGQVIMEDSETIYVSSMHWSSLCAEVSFETRLLRELLR